MGNSDEAIAAACKTAFNLMSSDTEVSKKVINPQLVSSLADLSENGWVLLIHFCVMFTGLTKVNIWYTVGQHNNSVRSISKVESWNLQHLYCFWQLRHLFTTLSVALIVVLSAPVFHLSTTASHSCCFLMKSAYFSRSFPKGRKAASLLLYTMWNEKNLQGALKKVNKKLWLIVN